MALWAVAWPVREAPGNSVPDTSAELYHTPTRAHDDVSTGPNMSKLQGPMKA